MPEMEIDFFDLEMALSQIADFKLALEEEQAELDVLLGADEPDDAAILISTDKVSRYERSIVQIQVEGRRYYYLLNPVPRPELCLVCNFNPINKNVILDVCPECGGGLKNNRASDIKEDLKSGGANWRCARFDVAIQQVVFFTEYTLGGEPDISGIEGI